MIDVLEGDDPPDPTEEFDVIPVWSDEDGTVAIYQGRNVAWFEPTREAKSNLTREQLDAESTALVEQELHFESRGNAEVFIATSLFATTTTSTTTTTTMPTTVAPPPTLAPIVATPTTTSTGA